MNTGQSSGNWPENSPVSAWLLWQPILFLNSHPAPLPDRLHPRPVSSPSVTAVFTAAMVAAASGVTVFMVMVAAGRV